MKQGLVGKHGKDNGMELAPGFPMGPGGPMPFGGMVQIQGIGMPDGPGPMGGAIHLIPVAKMGMSPFGPVHMGVLPMQGPGDSSPFEELFGQDDDPFGPLEAMDPFVQNFHRDIFSTLESQAGAHAGFFPGPMMLDGGNTVAASGMAGGFRVHKENGNFTLRASLPGYKMAFKDEQKTHDESENPLSVEVVGHSLIVRGQKTKGSMSSGFQRSFRLPKVANTDAIKVKYNVTDGTLAVDIPAQKGAVVSKEEDGNDDDGDEGGVEEMSFSSRPGMRMPTGSTIRLRGGQNPLQAMMEGMMQADEGMASVDQADEDPFVDLLMDGQRQKAEEKERGKDSSVRVVSVENKKEEEPAAAKKEVKSAVAPYWRRPVGAAKGTEDYSAIEIVVPEGVRVGLPDGRRVPCFNTANRSGRGPDWTLELPVSIKNEDCAWSQADRAKERIYRCQIEKEKVKHVHIQVVPDDDEL